MEENDINATINEIKEMMSSLIEKKGLKFIIEIKENLPKTEFDKDKIIQVLINLVNNALKSTEEGYIKITTSENDHFIQVSIQDSGCGIKQNDIHKLFQEYEQLERKGGGTGLGLVISQDIILAHSGKSGLNRLSEKGQLYILFCPSKFRKTKELIHEKNPTH